MFEIFPPRTHIIRIEYLASGTIYKITFEFKAEKMELKHVTVLWGLCAAYVF
jgi:hypothetical protein